MPQEMQLSPDNLPPDLTEAVEKKRFTGKKRLRQWMVFLKILAKFDEDVDDRMKKAGKKAAIFGVGTFVALFAGIFAIAGTEGYPVVIQVSAAVVLILAVMFIVYLIKYKGLSKINLDNSFRETLLPVLAILSEDIPDKKKIYLDLNLGNPTDKAYKISDKKIPPGRNRKLIERVYRFPAFHADIPLENGTRLLLDLVKQPASYDRYYKTARGKYKHKTKWKMVTFVTAGLIPDTSEFDVDQDQVSQMAEKEKMKLKEKKGSPVCSLTRKIKSKAPKVPEEPVPPELVLDMFMKLCTMLNPAS